MEQQTGTDLQKGTGLLAEHLAKSKEMFAGYTAHLDALIKALSGSDDPEKARKAAEATELVGALAKAAADKDAADKAAAAQPVAVPAVKAAVADDLVKAFTERTDLAITAMQDQFKAFMDNLAKTLEPPKASANGTATRVITKTEDNGGAAAAAALPAEPVFRPNGAPDNLKVSEEYRKAMGDVRGVPMHAE